MQATQSPAALFLLISLFFFAGCDSHTATQQAGKETPKTDYGIHTSYSFVYDPALDPAKVSPGNVKIWHDTLGMKLFEITLKPGDSLPMHAHPDHAFYVLEGGKVAFTPMGGERQVVDFMAGGGFINGPYTDAGRNIGTTTIRLLEVDVYRPRVK